MKKRVDKREISGKLCSYVTNLFFMIVSSGVKLPTIF